jgi:hypothetical protein
MNTDLAPTSGGIVGFAVLLWLFVATGGIAITILWLVIFWRAMRAHERLADAAERYCRHFARTASSDNNPFG